MKNTVSQSTISEVDFASFRSEALENLTWKIGTSIGAFVGGLYAREADLISSTGRAKQFSGRMGNIWRMLSDVTYPIVAYTTVRKPCCSVILVLTSFQGHEFNRSLYKVCTTLASGRASPDIFIGVL